MAQLSRHMSGELSIITFPPFYPPWTITTTNFGNASYLHAKLQLTENVCFITNYMASKKENKELLHIKD